MPYYNFKDEHGKEYGSFEAYYLDQNMCDEINAQDSSKDAPAFTPGWYWLAGFPGYLPDSDQPHGPFATEAEAVADAQSA